MKVNELVKQRGNQYGDYRQNLTDIGFAWSMWIRRKYNVDVRLQAADVAMMMKLLKVCREAFKHDPDNVADIEGYGLIYDELTKGEDKKSGFDPKESV